MLGQSKSRRQLSEPIFIGFAGRIGAGKTSAASYLSSKFDFQYTRYSKVLHEWFSSDGVDRDRLQEFGWDIMARGLQSELNARLIGELDPSRSAAIDGLRHPLDFESLKAAFGASFGMIFLDARPEIRFERQRQRFQDFAGFQAADMHSVESLIDSLRSQASVTISNEESQESLYQKLDSWVATLRPGDDR
jgi:dephospho-CoA kinase